MHPNCCTHALRICVELYSSLDLNLETTKQGHSAAGTTIHMLYSYVLFARLALHLMSYSVTGTTIDPSYYHHSTFLIIVELPLLNVYAYNPPDGVVV